MSDTESTSYFVYEIARTASVNSADIRTNGNVYSIIWGRAILVGCDTITEHINSFIKVNCL